MTGNLKSNESCAKQSITLLTQIHTWYLSQISQIRYVEKNLSCGEISNLYAWQMWKNLTFLHLLSNLKNFHMTDVEKSEVSPHLACIWCGECLYICTRYAVLSKKGVYCDLHRFVAKSVLSRFTHFCVEKNGTKYCVCGEKMTNIRYETTLGDSAAIQPLIIWMFKAQVLRLRRSPTIHWLLNYSFNFSLVLWNALVLHWCSGKMPWENIAQKLN